MTLVESQHRLALEQPRHARGQPVSLAELRAAGVEFPAVVISELELNGCAIERVYEHGQLAGVRLRTPGDADVGAARRRRWWSRRQRQTRAASTARLLCHPVFQGSQRSAAASADSRF